MIKIPCFCGHVTVRSKLPKKVKCGGCSRTLTVSVGKAGGKLSVKKSKYGAKRSRCRQNHWHHSMAEAKYCNTLAMLQKAGKIKSYLSQKNYPLYARGGERKIGTHYPDFVVTMLDDSIMVREVKSRGTVTALWKLKRAIFEYNYPDIPYMMIWV